MTGLSLAFPTVAPHAAPHRAAATRPTLPAAAPAALTTAEQARIADAFPPRPAVAQTLYGADRSLQTAAPLGARLDLSA